MLIILASLWSSFLDERVQVQTFAKLGPVFLACKNSDAAILLSPYLQLQGPLFFNQGALWHTNTAPYHHQHLPPCHQPFVRLKLALRQCGLAFHALAVLNSALLFLITSSVPSATHTHPLTTTQQDETCCSKHTRLQKERQKLLHWPISRAAFQSPDH